MKQLQHWNNIAELIRNPNLKGQDGKLHVLDAALISFATWGHHSLDIYLFIFKLWHTSTFKKDFLKTYTLRSNRWQMSNVFF